jgi:DNA-binding NarL/FixJ family response regulator
VEVSALGVLVVDDYEPFRRFVRSTLAKRQNLKVIGEASDGLEAVRKTEELKPDLIVLDIGLPTLNGIEVARQVRKLRPECKILFMSQGTSVDVAQEAFNLGALGYIVKTHAGSELLAAVDEVCQGRQFVSKGSRAAIGSALRSHQYPADSPSRKFFHRPQRKRRRSVIATRYSSILITKLFSSALLVLSKLLSKQRIP